MRYAYRVAVGWVVFLTIVIVTIGLLLLVGNWIATYPLAAATAVLSLLVLGTILNHIETFRAYWENPLRCHRRRAWFGRMFVQPFQFYILRQTDCPICCTMMPIRAFTQGMDCRGCGFNLREFEVAECRCWIRDSIKNMNRPMREVWISQNHASLEKAARFLGMSYERLYHDIVAGTVTGTRTNTKSPR